mgnify:CR=1 FL=1
MNRYLQINEVKILIFLICVNFFITNSHTEKEILPSKLQSKKLSNYNPKIKDVEVLFGAKRIGDIPHSHADISKARKLLGYNPKYSLKEGLKAPPATESS